MIGDERMDSNCGASNSTVQRSGSARKERKVWETLKKRLPEAKTRPFAILSLLDQLRSLNSPHLHELTQLEEGLRW